MRYVIAILVLLAACGGTTTINDKPAARIPHVAGTYTFHVYPGDIACNDGSSDRTDALDMTMSIAQDGTALQFTQIGAPDTDGFTIISTEPMTGTVDSRGWFSAEQDIRVRIDNLPGIFDVTYRIEGQFTLPTWSGDYRFTIHGQGGEACLYVSHFSGQRY